jgi:hypothetical protein
MSGKKRCASCKVRIEDEPCRCPKSRCEHLLFRKRDTPGSLGIQPAQALPQNEQQQLAEECKSTELSGLFSTLDTQLRHWQDQGISTQLMDDGEEHTPLQ